MASLPLPPYPLTLIKVVRFHVHSFIETSASSSKTQGRSVGPAEKARRNEAGRNESLQAWAEKPLGTDSHRFIFKRSSECWPLIGHKKCFCIIVPNRRTASPEFFSWFRKRLLLTRSRGRSRLLWLMHQRNVRSQETISLIYTLYFKILSTWKLKKLFQKDKLELTTGIHACIDHAFVNIGSLRYDTLWSVRNRIFSVQNELLLLIAS